VRVEDMPTIEHGTKRRIDGLQLSEYLKSFPADCIATEHVHSMPQQGVASTFSFGMSYGIALAIGDVYATEKIDVRPQLWKKHFGLIKQPKDAARQLVLEKFPDDADRFKRKKDHGRADATLIALWAYETREL